MPGLDESSPWQSMSIQMKTVQKVKHASNTKIGLSQASLRLFLFCKQSTPLSREFNFAKTCEPKQMNIFLSPHTSYLGMVILCLKLLQSVVSFMFTKSFSDEMFFFRRWQNKKRKCRYTEIIITNLVSSALHR